MSACEKCWADASWIARMTGRMTADVYRELIDADPKHDNQEQDR